MRRLGISFPGWVGAVVFFSSLAACGGHADFPVNDDGGFLADGASAAADGSAVTTLPDGAIVPRDGGVPDATMTDGAAGDGAARDGSTATDGALSDASGTQDAATCATGTICSGVCVDPTSDPSIAAAVRSSVWGRRFARTAYAPRHARADRPTAAGRA